MDSAISVTSHSSSACPLGLPLQEKRSSYVNKDGVVMRKPSKHDISEADDIFSKDEPRQKSPEGESPRIQRLAKSGLYINPSDALKFFSTQVHLIYIIISTFTSLRPSASSVGVPLYNFCSRITKCH